MYKKRRISGFSVIEISIALIIIGLLAGAILVGSEIISSARMRAQITQIEKLNASVSAFRNKYNCLPGDCMHAVDYKLGTLGGVGTNGNGDDLISAADYNSDGTVSAITVQSLEGQEFENFWVHLKRSGLTDIDYQEYDRATTPAPIPGIHSPALEFPGVGVEGNKTGGVWLGVFDPNFDYEYIPGQTTQAFQGGLVVNRPFKANSWLLTTTAEERTDIGVYLPTDAFSLDTKIDDGFPRRGRVRAIGQQYNTVPNMLDPVATPRFEFARSTAYKNYTGNNPNLKDGCIDVIDVALSGPERNLGINAPYHTQKYQPAVGKLCALLIQFNF